MAFINSLSSRARATFGAAILIILIAFGYATWWLLHQEYAVLFSGMKETDAAEVTSGLQKLKVPYKIAGNGDTVLVPSDQVHQARLDLMSEGVPLRGVVGFEIFNETDYGMTEFSQKVNYQRALQGELARSIMTLEAVKFARVHLSLRRASLFQTDDERPKASITLIMENAAAIDSRKIVGIQQLVAAAVEGLKTEDVTIVDQKGIALAGSTSDNQQGNTDARFREKKQIEDSIRGKLNGLLANTFKLDEIALSVDVTLNYDKVKTVREEVLGGNGKTGKSADNSLLVRKHETRDNQPALNRESDSGVTQARQSTNIEQEFALGKQLKETIVAPGGISRISVGLMLPESVIKNNAELDRLEKVISAAAGLDFERGDKIEIGKYIASSSSQSKEVEAPIELTANTDSSALKKDVSRTERATDMPWWKNYFWVPVIIFISLIGALFLRSNRRKPVTKPLTHEQRDALLAEVRTWLDQPVALLERSQ